MRQERLEYLQKKYESRLNTVKDSDMMANVSGEPKRPKGPAMGPGRHGKQSMAVGKPKDLGKTMGRLFSYISQSILLCEIVSIQSHANCNKLTIYRQASTE